MYSTIHITLGTVRGIYYYHSEYGIILNACGVHVMEANHVLDGLASTRGNRWQVPCNQCFPNQRTVTGPICPFPFKSIFMFFYMPVQCSLFSPCYELLLGRLPVG
jgi:hypothetical protein